MSEPPADEVPQAEPSTYAPAADQAAERLQAIDDAQLDEHVEIYEDVHRHLQEGLAELDEGRP